MSVNLIVNGVSFPYPQTGDSLWGDNATNWASAVTSGMLQKAGGTFTLTADVDFGASFGLKSLYYKSRATNPSASGIVRLGNTESVGWRNFDNDGNLLLGVDTSDRLTYDGSLVFLTATGLITNAEVDAAAAIAYSKLNLTGGIVNADVNAAAAIAYSKLNLATSIVNADVNASAAIAYSKLNLGTSIVNADINASAAIVYSKLSLTGGIVNADVNASAAIVYSKLSLTGGIVNADVNASAAIAYSKLSLAASIANSDLTTMAAHTFKGNNTGSTAAPLDLTATELTAELNQFVGDAGGGGTKGLVTTPASGDATKFLRGDATWQTISSSPPYYISTLLTTRVTSTPNAAGEYRTYKKDLNNPTGTDQAPTTGPSGSNGMRIYAKEYAAAGTNGETNRWEIYVGTGKRVQFEFYATTGRADSVCPALFMFAVTLLNSQVLIGTMFGYDPSTGVAFIDTIQQASFVTTRVVGEGYAANGGQLSDLFDCYFDILVTD